MPYLSVLTTAGWMKKTNGANLSASESASTDTTSTRPARNVAINSKVKMGGMMLEQDNGRYGSSYNSSSPSAPQTHSVYSSPSAPPAPPPPGTKKAEPAPPPAPVVTNFGPPPPAPPAPKKGVTGSSYASGHQAPSAPAAVANTTHYVPSNAPIPPAPPAPGSAPISAPLAPVKQATKFGTPRAPSSNSSPNIPPAYPKTVPTAPPTAAKKTYGSPSYSSNVPSAPPSAPPAAKKTSYSMPSYNTSPASPSLNSGPKKTSTPSYTSQPTYVVPSAPKSNIGSYGASNAPIPPAPPGAPKKSPYGSNTTPSAPKQTFIPKTEQRGFEPSAAARNVGGSQPTTRSSSSAHLIPANIDKASIVQKANDSYLKKIHTDLRNAGLLKEAFGNDWQDQIFVDWDAILSSSGFISKYPDPTVILGAIKDTLSTQGFQTSMECWRATMLQASDDKERALLASIKQFIITVDMSLPSNIDPNWTWDKANKVLTTTHNPLSLIDGLQWGYYRFGDELHNGSSNNWFVSLLWLLNGNVLPYMPSSKNVRPHVEPDGVTYRSGLQDGVDAVEVNFGFGGFDGVKGTRKCSTCNGTGNWGSQHKFKKCFRCNGKGLV